MLRNQEKGQFFTSCLRSPPAPRHCITPERIPIGEDGSGPSPALWQGGPMSFRGVQVLAASYTFTWLPFVDGQVAREVREMDLRRLLASALLSRPARTASLTDCRATSILCVATRTSMMLRLTVVTGSPSCLPISWGERLARWIATQSGHFRRNLAVVGTVRFTRDGFASDMP